MTYESSDAAGPSLTSDDLREAWRRRSIDAGWSLPGDWWSPAVETVTEAICAGRGLGPALDRLGRARGRAGVGIGETIGDLGALYAELHGAEPPIGSVRATAEGWAETGITSALTCEDPLTGLVSAAYLRSRLGELYRESAHTGTAVSDTHRMVIVDIRDSGDPWRKLARAVVIGADLRAVFAGGETLTLLAPDRAAALVPSRPELDFQAARLRKSLAGAPVWIERLPPDLRTALTVIDDLSC